jgi:NAD(P)-dependent dehydrogenase (short-subunit alcohol dehydrogenase family)
MMMPTRAVRPVYAVSGARRGPTTNESDEMANDQYTFTDPTKLYSHIDTKKQYQAESGLDAKLENKADLGEDSYRGSGRLEGRKALVTGGDSGIGAAAAIAFAREGADVAIAYLPSEEEDAQRIVGLITDAGRVAVALPGDVTDPSYCRNLVAKAVDGLGGLDILVNNAAKQQHVEALTDLTDEQFDETFKTNVYAMFWITKAALPHLAPGSTIINTSSIQAYQPSENLLDYATTKAAINAFSKGLSQQLAPMGIRVNVVAPGPVWTPLQTAGGQPQEKLPEFGQSTPLGRPGQPAELAPAFVFLASPESSFVVGETLHVNGGEPTP